MIAKIATTMTRILVATEKTNTVRRVAILTDIVARTRDVPELNLFPYESNLEFTFGSASLSRPVFRKF